MYYVDEACNTCEPESSLECLRCPDNPHIETLKCEYCDNEVTVKGDDMCPECEFNINEEE